MAIALEVNSCLDQLPVPFNVDILVRVHQNIGDGGIFQQRLQRSQAEDFVQDFFRQAVALRHADRQVVFAKNLFQLLLHLPAQLVPALRFDSIHVQHTQKLLVYTCLEAGVPLFTLNERGPDWNEASSGERPSAHFRFSYDCALTQWPNPHWVYRTGIVTRLLANPPMVRLTKMFVAGETSAGTRTVTWYLPGTPGAKPL